MSLAALIARRMLGRQAPAAKPKRGSSKTSVRLQGHVQATAPARSVSVEHPASKPAPSAPRVFVDVVRNPGPPRAPAPSPVLAPLPEALVTPPPPVPPVSGTWKRQCAARCGETGHRCGLLEGHVGAHGDARGAFRRLAVEGQTRFLRDERLAVAALSSADVGDPDSPGARRAVRAVGPKYASEGNHLVDAELRARRQQGGGNQATTIAPSTSSSPSECTDPLNPKENHG